MAEKEKMTNEDKLRLLELIIANLSPLSKVFRDLSEIIEEHISPESTGQFYLEDENAREKVIFLANQSLENLSRLISVLYENKDNPDISFEEKSFLSIFVKEVLEPFMLGIKDCLILIGERTPNSADEATLAQNMTNKFIEGTQKLSEIIDLLTEDI